MATSKKAAPAAKKNKKAVAKKSPRGGSKAAKPKAAPSGVTGKNLAVVDGNLTEMKLIFKKGAKEYSISKLPGQEPSVWELQKAQGLGRRKGVAITDEKMREKIRELCSDVMKLFK